MFENILDYLDKQEQEKEEVHIDKECGECGECQVGCDECSISHIWEYNET
jgi:ferredoxin-like protein FixX